MKTPLHVSLCQMVTYEYYTVPYYGSEVVIPAVLQDGKW